MRMKDKKSGFLIFAVVIVAVVVLAVTCSGGSDKEESNKEAKGSSKTTTESTSDQTTSKTQTTVTKGNVYNKKNLVIDVPVYLQAAARMSALRTRREILKIWLKRMWNAYPK